MSFHVKLDFFADLGGNIASLSTKMGVHVHDRAVSHLPDRPISPDQRLATELFLITAGPQLVTTVAMTLAPNGISVMPLKGVLLQKLVYDNTKSFRPIGDVDLLVPAERFFEALGLLRARGFTDECWERGEWQVTLKKPGGLPLGIDLHRRLTRTSRARLDPEAMFARGASDTRLFGAPVVLPSSEDLFAHLLLHATLHWINLGTLHRPEDFEALAEARAMNAARCARHLQDQGMVAHASLMLPLIAAEVGGGSFLSALIRLLAPGPRERAIIGVLRALTRQFPAGTPGRRLAGLALAPSISRALLDALRDRALTRPAGRVWTPPAKPRRPNVR